MCLTLKQLFEKEGYAASVALSAKEAFAKLQETRFNLLICDVRMPDMGGIALLSKVGSDIPVIMMTAYATIETARKAFKLGARDYLTKPFKFEELLVMSRQFMRTSSAYEKEDGAEVLLKSRDPAFRHMLGLAEKFSETDLPILITGESGAGKEVIADYIFERSRKLGSLVKINCAAIPDTLLEGELFGYEKGAYTGAVTSRAGKIEEANGGTLFLDEIGDMPLLLQAKMLRFLQDLTVVRLGSNRAIPIRTRIIAASNHDLVDLVKKGQFRLDLFHRLSGVHLKVSPLRERPDDIEPCARFFLDMFNRKYRKQIGGLTDEVLGILRSYEWPGNVRELKYAMERAVVICEQDLLGVEHLPDSMLATRDPSTRGDAQGETSVLNALEDYRNDFARKIILEALKRANGNKVEAAKTLKISRQTLYNKIKALGITNEFR